MSKRNGCDCPECQECCKREAGWFMPDEVGIAAEYLGLTDDEFTQTYLREHLHSGVMVLSPKMDREKGACVFLEGGRCKIHPVKPYECRKVFGCESRRRHKRIREIILKQWS